MKEAFNIKYRPQIESGEYKVVTREDRPVEVKIWDLKGDFPIVGVYYDAKNNRETAVQVTAEGRCSVTSGEEYCDDFFIITDKPELTEFEGELKTIINTFSSCGDFMSDESARNIGKILLDTAREQLTAELPHWKKCWEDPKRPREIRTHVGCFEYMGYEINLEEAFEKLPKED